MSRAGEDRGGGVGDGRDGRERRDRPEGGRRFEPALGEALAALEAAGFSEAEVYAKRGRSRRLVLATGRRGASYHQEAGWAVRASTDRASLFTTATGALPADPTAGGHPLGTLLRTDTADGLPLVLPGPDAVPRAAAPWKEPSDYETPLVGETEGLRILDALERELAAEVPGARLLGAWLEDGSSDSRLANSHGVAGRWRLRVALLRAEAALGSTRTSIELAAREARRFGPAAVARQLADRLVAAGAESSFTGRDRAEVILAPALGARLLAALTPMLVGPGAAERAAALADLKGRLASDAVTVIDDGRLDGGVLAAPVDGEGLPTRRAVLVEGGVFRGPLLGWDANRNAERGDAGEGSSRRGPRRGAPPAACRRRASWRDLPETAPSHLYLAADPQVRAGDLVADLPRGYYLLAATAAPRIDWGSGTPGGTFRVPVLGYEVREGRARGPLSGVTLTGPLTTLLGGIRVVARDLTFFPYDGMIGAPTLRVSGLELRAQAK